LKNSLVFWVEEYFYNPDIFQKILSFLLLPLSWLYCFIMYLRYKLKKAEDFAIPIISVGNLSVGGSGKTPLVTALALKYENTAIVLRGYGRKSKGLFVVKNKEKIVVDVETSGDEAMIYAHKLKNAIVIVSEDRKEGIAKAKEMGAKVVFLDDAYSKHDIEKFDILIDVQTQNNSCLPSGAFRERLWAGKDVLVLKDGVDFKRRVQLKDKCAKMSLLTAIARPQRLDEYLPAVVSKNYFEDHHFFTQDELENILAKDGSDSLLVTYKDFVKVESFGIALSLLDLEVTVDEKVFKIIGNYIASKN
jgi:tetraacyldisaccharide 4'-kinase